MTKALSSNPETDTFEYVQQMDGLYGIMLAAMRGVKPTEKHNKEWIAETAHQCLLAAMKEYLNE